MGRYLKIKKIKNKKGVDLQHLYICINFNISLNEMHPLLPAENVIISLQAGCSLV